NAVEDLLHQAGLVAGVEDPAQQAAGPDAAKLAVGFDEPDVGGDAKMPLRLGGCNCRSDTGWPTAADDHVCFLNNRDVQLFPECCMDGLCIGHAKSLRHVLNHLLSVMDDNVVIREPCQAPWARSGGSILNCLRYSPGGTPMTRRNPREKLLLSVKPTSYAIRVTSSRPFFKRLHARSTRVRS